MGNDEHIHAKSCICPECRDRDAGYEAGRDAGYADAVADVVAMLEEQMRGLELMMPVARVALRYVRSLLNRMHTGAHVGAAKRLDP